MILIHTHKIRILKQINNIYFVNLKVLCLEDNNIESI